MVTKENRISGYLPQQRRPASSLPDMADISRSGEQWLKSAQSFVTERPVISLCGAFATGMVIAWFFKRTR
ncbi:MAG: hypothetical protein WCJ09_21215 [Planctomycetota bacterium]